MAFDLFTLAVWLWVCLVHFERPFQAAFFMPVLLVAAIMASFLCWFIEESQELIDRMGKW